MRRIWLMGGGELTAAFAGHGLTDEYIISVIPILLGDGIPLFPPPGLEQSLELVGSLTQADLVQMHYRKPRRSL